MAMPVGRSTTLVQTEISLQLWDELPQTFCTDFHGPQMRNPYDFSDPLTFHSAAPAGQIFLSHLSSEISQYLLNGLTQTLSYIATERC